MCYANDWKKFIHCTLVTWRKNTSIVKSSKKWSCNFFGFLALTRFVINPIVVLKRSWKNLNGTYGSILHQNISKWIPYFYSTVSNKCGGSNKRGGLQILDRIKIQLKCIDSSFEKLVLNQLLLSFLPEEMSEINTVHEPNLWFSSNFFSE